MNEEPEYNTRHYDAVTSIAANRNSAMQASRNRRRQLDDDTAPRHTDRNIKIVMDAVSGATYRGLAAMHNMDQMRIMGIISMTIWQVAPDLHERLIHDGVFNYERVINDESVGDRFRVALVKYKLRGGGRDDD